MTLHPQSVAALEEWSRGPRVTDPGFGADDLAALRREAREAAAAEEREQVERVRDVDADGVPCRLYVPGNVTGRALVYLHGGGFVLGDLETHDAQCRRLANRTRSLVLAVDYRRPPEHRFPAAPDDATTALGWLARSAGGLGADPQRLAAVGDSAGANLAVVAALRRPGVLAACVLVYPFVDASTTGPSAAGPASARADGGITRAEAQWYWEQYARGPEDRDDPDLSPFCSDRLGELPVSLVQVAEHDLLAAEDTELARRIAAAGADVRLAAYAGMVHGFWRHPRLFDAAEEALAEAVAFLDEHV